MKCCIIKSEKGNGQIEITPMNLEEAYAIQGFLDGTNMGNDFNDVIKIDYSVFDGPIPSKERSMKCMILRKGMVEIRPLHAQHAYAIKGILKNKNLGDDFEKVFKINYAILEKGEDESE